MLILRITGSRCQVMRGSNLFLVFTWSEVFYREARLRVRGPRKHLSAARTPRRVNLELQYFDDGRLQPPKLACRVLLGGHHAGHHAGQLLVLANHGRDGHLGLANANFAAARE